MYYIIYINKIQYRYAHALTFLNISKYLMEIN